MKKSLILSGIAMMVFVISGCGKKQSQEASAPFEMEEAMQDVNSTLSNEVAASPQDSAEQNQADPNLAMPQATAIDPSAPFVKPTNQEVQQSLKNAGFYTGTVDGALGPHTKKAIRDFQAQNNLTTDGRVGPQTWARLAPYLNSSAAAPTAPATTAEGSPSD